MEWLLEFGSFDRSIRHTLISDHNVLFCFFFQTKLLIHKSIVTLNTGNEYEKNRKTRTTQRRNRKKESLKSMYRVWCGTLDTYTMWFMIVINHRRCFWVLERNHSNWLPLLWPHEIFCLLLNGERMIISVIVRLWSDVSYNL